MTKKAGLLLLAVCVCLLAACGSEKKVSGKIVEAIVEQENGTVSFVVHTNTDKEIGLFITDETNVFSFAEGLSIDEFKKGMLTDVTISAEYENVSRSLTTPKGQEMVAYQAQQMEVTGFLTSETASMLDGTTLGIWRDAYGFAYTLPNGTELLRVRELVGPDRVYVGGVESLDDLPKDAQAKVLEFYEEQGLLYDLQEELEKAYDGYLKQEANTKFDAYSASQDIAPTASNERMMCFLTSVLLPIDSAHGYERRTGAAFDRNTGEHISNWELFSCSPEEAKQKILDIAGISDPALRKEIEKAFQPEYIILFPDNLEVCFPQGTLPSQESSYILGLDYDEKLCEILKEWAVPKSSK